MAPLQRSIRTMDGLPWTISRSQSPCHRNSLARSADGFDSAWKLPATELALAALVKK
jgi:hypothetical protein